MASRRKERLNEVIRRHVSQRIVTEVNDPRIGFVTVTKAEIYDDYSGADIYLTVMGSKKEKDKTIRSLNHMKGFFQKDLGEIMRTRLTPKLIFRIDDAAERAYGMDQLINKARSGDPDQQAQKSESDVV